MIEAHTEIGDRIELVSLSRTFTFSSHVLAILTDRHCTFDILNTPAMRITLGFSIRKTVIG